MHPVLFQVGPLVVYSYGFFLALAYLAATFIFWREGKRRGFKEEKLIDLSVLSLLAAIIGGRLFYALINWKVFEGELGRIFAIWEGGFSYYGSFIFVFFVGYYLIKKWRWDFFQIADIAALGALAAIFFGKIGSFLSGSDYGGLTSLPWGVQATFLEGTRHPVQLYEAGFSLILLFIFYARYAKNLTRLGEIRSGSVFLYFIFFNSLGRIVFEEFRGDSTFLGPFRLASILAFLLAVVSLGALYYYQYRNLRADMRNISHRLLGVQFWRKKY